MNSEKEKWLLMIVLSVIWGSSFILIKKSLEQYNPYEVGGLRVLIAGLVMLPVALVHLKKFPKKHILWLIFAALTGSFFPMFLFPLAETRVSSIIAGIINSMMPIFVIVVGALVWKFETTKRQILGILVSFAGVCLLTVGSGERSGFELIPILLLLLAVLLYAVSTTTIKKKLAEIPAFILSGYVFGLVLLLPSLVAVALSGFFQDFDFSREKWTGLGYVSLLSVFGTGLAMVINYRLLSISTPLFASTVTLLMPLVALFWGLLDGESISFQQLAGGIVVVAGLIFLRTKSKKLQ